MLIFVGHFERHRPLKKTIPSVVMILLLQSLLRFIHNGRDGEIGDLRLAFIQIGRTGRGTRRGGGQQTRRRSDGCRRREVRRNHGVYSEFTICQWLKKKAFFLGLFAVCCVVCMYSSDGACFFTRDLFRRDCRRRPATFFSSLLNSHTHPPM